MHRLLINNWVTVLAVVFCVLLGPVSAFGETEGGFLALGLAGARDHSDDNNLFLDSPALMLSVNAVRSTYVFVARYSRLDIAQSRGDIALVCERIFRNDRYLISGGLGLSILYSDKGIRSHGGNEGLFDEIGLGWSMEAVRSSGALGFGLVAYGAIANEQAFTAVGISVLYGSS